jgi:protein involved in polysaccharide export with SLBB domain
MRKRSTTIKSTLLFIVFTFAAVGISMAQTPASNTSNGFSLFNLFGGGESSQNQAETTNTTTVVEKASKEQADDSSDLKTPKDVQLSEFEIRRMELQKKKLTLEAELAELMEVEEITEQDSINIRIKKENLRLLYLREQHLLKEELNALGGGENKFGNSGIFGHHFFRGGGIKFYQRAKDAVPSNDYLLGPTDKLHIEAWGTSRKSFDIEIGDDGYANMPFGRRVYLNGLTLGKAKKLLRLRLTQMVSNSSIDISVVRYRTITVNIIGEVFKPGSYVIPATNTAYNALTIMGGPTNIGSVRNIYIKRSGKIVDSLDVYNYMINSEKSREIYLQNNDYIIVEPLQRVVKVNGAVRRPGNYELKDHETLENLIEIAAGITETTYLKDILVYRVIDHERYEQISVNYDSIQNAKSLFILKGSDQVTFRSITKDAYQLVKISGAVNIPGNYKISNKGTIRDLLTQSNGFLREAHIGDAYIIRTDDNFIKQYIRINLENVDDPNAEVNKIKLLPYDEIHIFSKLDYLNLGTVSVTGSIKTPYSMTFAEGMTLRDAVLVAGGFIPETYLNEAYIIRTDKEFNKSFLRVNLNENIEGNTDLDSVMMEPFDRLHIFSKKQFLDLGSVSISGAVREPQEMGFAENMSIQDMIIVAGGLIPETYMKRGVLIRTDETTNEKTTIVFDVDDVMNNESSAENIALEKNDEIEIFSKITMRDTFTISIQGEVHNPGDFPYAANMTLKDLILRSGGLMTSAINAKLEIVRVFENGSDPVNLVPIQPQVITFDIGTVLELKPEFEDFILYPYDMVSIRKNPFYMDAKQVTLSGSVFYPGTYTLVSENETLADVIERAGGVRPYAFMDGVEFTRITDIGPTKIVTNMRKALRRQKSRYNYILKDQDSIHLPVANELVKISGNIRNLDHDNLSIYFKKHRRAKYYIKHFAGGFAENSMKRNTYVKFADGRAKTTKNFLLFKIYPKPQPGSEIVVVKSEKVKKPFNIDESLNKLTMRLTAMLTVIALVKLATQ